MNTENPVLVADKLDFAYGDNRVLEDVTVSIAPRKIVSIMGRSGSGKSTLLHLMAGLLKPNAGTLFLEGSRYDNLPDTQLADFRLQHFGLVFQFGDLVQELTLEENTALPLRALGKRKHAAHQDALNALELVGIRELANRFPSDVSGGQMQRCAIARAIAHRPKIVLADEPTGALDEQSSIQVIKVLTSLRDRAGCSVVIVTHDGQIAAECDRVIRISDGRVIA